MVAPNAAFETGLVRGPAQLRTRPKTRLVRQVRGGSSHIFVPIAT